MGTRVDAGRANQKVCRDAGERCWQLDQSHRRGVAGSCGVWACFGRRTRASADSRAGGVCSSQWRPAAGVPVLSSAPSDPLRMWAYWAGASLCRGGAGSGAGRCLEELKPLFTGTEVAEPASRSRLLLTCAPRGLCTHVGGPGVSCPRLPV